MTVSEFLKKAKDVYDTEPEIRKNLSKDEFLAYVKKSFEDYMEFQSLKNMPYKQFEEKYMEKKIARFPRWYNKDGPCELCFLYFRDSNVLFTREMKDGELVLVPQTYLMTLDAEGNTLRMWNEELEG